MEYLAAAVWAFLFGFLAGRRCEGNRWMENANRIQRLEWRGKLFKVNKDQ